MRKVVGLDVSLDKTAVCVLDRDGTLVWQGKVGSEPEPLSTSSTSGRLISISLALRPARCRNGCTVI
jgi:hypothetical protein